MGVNLRWKLRQQLGTTLSESRATRKDKLGLYLKWEFEKKDTLEYNTCIFHVDKIRALEWHDFQLWALLMY